MPLLDAIEGPEDLRRLSYGELDELACEIRQFIVEAVAAAGARGGHLGSNLGAVELTLALHRVFDSPRDILLWDTGHQAYVHKLVTGRQERFPTLRFASTAVRPWPVNGTPAPARTPGAGTRGSPDPCSPSCPARRTPWPPAGHCNAPSS